ATSADEPSPWRWSCENNKCVKLRNDPQNQEPVLSMEACKMFCNEYGLLWPQPTGQVQLGNFLSKININNIVVERFKDVVATAVPKGISPKATGKAFAVNLVNNNPDLKEFSLGFDESYSINVASLNDKVNATITANSFFGLRHGLETLSQLIVYDDIRNHVLIVRDVTISDKPAYPYRGVLLDTARNYYTVDSIKSTIVKVSRSFPREDLILADMELWLQIYTKQQIGEVVQYGLERGVRVLPEFDAPAHVGEGWQDTGLTTCFNPPCGQLNPAREELYEHLEDIYSDMAADMFHMGGDEVNYRCWNSSDEIQRFMVQNRWDLQSSGFLKLWNYFQEKAQNRAYKAFGKKLPLILWTSTLTEYSDVENYLNVNDYIIQVWTTGTNPHIKSLLKKGYRLIISNYDALYFDCGFGSWVGEGNNWCSPYIGWQKVYDNDLSAMAGAEAALWSEQSDSATLEGRLWPRAAAMAERLWSDPPGKWRDAEYRMLHMRERFIRMGIDADSLQPEWCYQNEGHCSS
ncbi:Beta-hexosaminidase, partial [Operophtera brumata]